MLYPDLQILNKAHEKLAWYFKLKVGALTKMVLFLVRIVMSHFTNPKTLPDPQRTTKEKFVAAFQ